MEAPKKMGKGMMKSMKALGNGTASVTKDAFIWPVEAMKAPGKKLGKQHTPAPAPALSKSSSSLSDTPSDDGSGGVSGKLGNAFDATKAGMKWMAKPVTSSGKLVSGWVGSKSFSKSKGVPANSSFSGSFKPVEEQQWKVHDNKEWRSMNVHTNNLNELNDDDYRVV